MTFDCATRLPETIPEFTNYADFTEYVENWLQANGIYYDSDSLIDWIYDFANIYEETYGIDPVEMM